jgi:hypothetical protein
MYHKPTLRPAPLLFRRARMALKIVDTFRRRV